MDSRWLLLGILTLLMIAGSPFSARSAEKSGTVRIGVYLPMTGPMAARGQSEYTGIKLAHEIQPSVLGTKVELFLVDTETEKIGTAGAATRLIKEHKVHALIGELSGPDPLRGIAFAERARKPTIIPFMPSPATANMRYAFCISLTNALQGQAAARYAFSRLKAEKAAILMDIEKDHSIDLATIFMDHFKMIGGKIVAIAYCRSGDGDFTTQLSSIMSANPDVLYLTVSYPEITHICRQSFDMGINIQFIASAETHTPEFITAGGEYVEGVILTSDLGREGGLPDVARAYLSAYEKETGVRAGRFDILGANAYLLLINAIQKARSTAGSKIRQALARTEGFRGVSGLIDIDREGNAVQETLILKVRNGKFRYVEAVPPEKGRGREP